MRPVSITSLRRAALKAFAARVVPLGFVKAADGVFARTQGDLAQLLRVSVSRPAGSKHGAQIEIGASLRFGRVEAFLELALPDQPPGTSTLTMPQTEALELDAAIAWLDANASLEALDRALNPSQPPPNGQVVGIGAGPHAWHRGLVAAHLLGRDLTWLKAMRLEQARHLPRFVQSELPTLIAAIDAGARPSP